MARFKRAYPGLPYIQQFAATYAPVTPGTPGAYQAAPVLPRRAAPARAQVGPLAGAIGGGVAVPPDPPTLVASYPVYQATPANTSLVSPAFTPAVGELLVIKGVTEDTGHLLSTPTGGGLTYTLRVSQVGVASNVNAYIWTAPVTASASMTVTVAETGNTGVYSMVVERWSGAQLAATPATVDTRGSGAPSTTLTTVGASSIVSWLNGDWAAIDGTSRAYRTTSAVPAEDGYTTTAGLYTAYYAYQVATAPGAQTFGLTAPTGQTWSAARHRDRKPGPGRCRGAVPAALRRPGVEPAVPAPAEAVPGASAAVRGVGHHRAGIAFVPAPAEAACRDRRRQPVQRRGRRPSTPRPGRHRLPAAHRSRSGARPRHGRSPARVPLRAAASPHRPPPRWAHRRHPRPARSSLTCPRTGRKSAPAPSRPAGSPPRTFPSASSRSRSPARSSFTVPPARARLGQRGLAAGGVPSAAPALGSPSRPAPRPVISRLVPRRALWRGLATQNIAAVSLGAAAPAIAFTVARNPIPARARLGPRSASSGGRAVPAPPLGSLPQPAPRPVIQHFAPRRAMWRGLATQNVTPPVPVRARPVIRHAPAPARVLWRGLAVPPPPGVPSRPKPFTARNPIPARARAGTGTVAGGTIGLVNLPAGAVPVTAYQRPPVQARRPAPAQAWTGHGTGAGGVTGTASSYRIWPDTPGPVADSGDASAYTLGVQFTLSQDATFSGIWFWRATIADALPTSAAIFQVTGPGTGVLVPGTSVTFAPTGATGWIKAPSSAGTVLSAGVSYKAVATQATATAWYSATAHYWDTGDGAGGITSGIISAPGNAGADGGQDTFSAGGTLTYPAASFNATNYWVDVEVALIPPVIPGTPGAYQRPAPYIKRPAPARASTGPRGAIAGGVIGLVNPSGPGTGAPQPTFPVVPPGPPGHRASVGHGGAGGGIASGAANAVPVPVVTAYQRTAPQIRHIPPARASLGPAGAAAGGTAVQIPQLGTPQVAVNPVFGQRHVTRAWLGHGTVAGGIAFGAANAVPIPVVTAYRRTAPQIKRPAPARAHLGPRGNVAAGVTAPPPLVPGLPQPTVPDLVYRPPLRQPRGIWRGLASRAVTAATGQAYQRPLPYIKRPAPSRAVTGHGGVAGGIASRAITTPTGQQYQRAAPYVKRPSPARALIGHGGVAGGVASRNITTPTGQSYQRPVPYIKRPAPKRAVVGHGGTSGGQAGLRNLTATAYQARPFIFRSPPPARARLGPRGTISNGVASRIVAGPGTPQYGIPSIPGRRPPPLARAVFGGRIGLATVYAFPPPVTWQVAPVLPLTVTIAPAAPMAVTAAPAAPMAVTAAEPGVWGSTTLPPPAAVTITPPPAVQAGPAHGPLKE